MRTCAPCATVYITIVIIGFGDPIHICVAGMRVGNEIRPEVAGDAVRKVGAETINALALPEGHKLILFGIGRTGVGGIGVVAVVIEHSGIGPIVSAAGENVAIVA